MSNFSQEDLDNIQKWFKDCKKWKQEHGIDPNLVRKRMEKFRQDMDDELDHLTRKLWDKRYDIPDEEESNDGVWWNMEHKTTNRKPPADDTTWANLWGMSNWNQPMFGFYSPEKSEQELRNEGFEKWLNSLPDEGSAT